MRRWAAAALLVLAAGARAQSASVRLDGDTILFDGRIESTSVATFLQLVRHPAVTRLAIRSPGGLVAPALEMADAVFARGLDVAVDQSCLSSCANYARRETDFYRRIGVDGFVCWFGKLAPYSVAEFYTLSVEDMARFGITGVTVRNPQAPSRPEVQQLAIDPAMVTFIRPDAPPAP